MSACSAARATAAMSAGELNATRSVIVPGALERSRRSIENRQVFFVVRTSQQDAHGVLRACTISRPARTFECIKHKAM